MEDFALTGATWFWMFVPMPLLILLSIISVLRHKGE